LVVRDPKVGIVGLGYMGLGTALAFAARGLPVVGYDLKPEIRAAVARGSTPYHEAGLPELLRSEVRAGRFHVVDQLEELVRFAEGIFLCVPTPPGRNGRIDLRPLRRATRDVGRAISKVDGYRLVVVKSTVVPGTTETVVRPELLRQSRKSSREVGAASNPEFLAEGTIVHDTLHPDRVVIGTSDRRAEAWLRRVYRPFRAPVVALSPSGAELVKYSANAFLALKVSFANEIARLADQLGVHVDRVMEAVGLDPRIGPSFLRAGPGFGGSCFEKDVSAFVARAKELGVPLHTAATALRVNDEQLRYVFDFLRSTVGSVAGKKVALLGLAFKAGTDDVRESRALPIARRLVLDGAVVRAHDPVALELFRRTWRPPSLRARGRIEFCRSLKKTLTGADVAILQADWPEYSRWTRARSRWMHCPLLIDLRRAVDPHAAARAGLTVVGLGAGASRAMPSPTGSPEVR
jgi:UDPglucose 6-dehydrogenase